MDELEDSGAFEDALSDKDSIDRELDSLSTNSEVDAELETLKGELGKGEPASDDAGESTDEEIDTELADIESEIDSDDLEADLDGDDDADEEVDVELGVRGRRRRTAELTRYCSALGRAPVPARPGPRADLAASHFDPVVLVLGEQQRPVEVGVVE